MSAPAQSTIAQQLRRACDELEQGLRAGEDCSAHQLLQTYTDLFADKESALELIYTEFVVRCELGQSPSPDRWIDAFPKWQGDLKELFQIDQLLAGGDLETSSGAAAQTDGLATTSANAHRGERVGQYDLIEEVGRGGMGVVFKARQRGLNRFVAVKMILSSYASSTDYARFRLEAKAASKLQHPNIVQIYEVGLQSRVPYLAMELVDGPSLQEQLADSPLTPHSAAALVQTLAHAVEFAHRHGIIHRDLKPANILLAADGTPKIADFGLAKQISSLEENPITHTDALLGTPSYMAPEQIDSRQEVCTETDIYALGVILYEALTGKLPFRANSPLETLEQVRLQEPIPPRRLQSNISKDLNTICLRCLRKEPSNRYRTAAQLAEDLHRFLEGRPILARKTSSAARSWMWCRRRPLAATLLGALMCALLAGAAGVTSQWMRAERGWQQANHHADLARLQRDEAVRASDEARQARDQANANLAQARETVDRLTALSYELENRAGGKLLRQRLLEEALDLYETLLQQQGDDPAIRLDTALAALRAASLQHELGHHQAAESTIRRGIAILDEVSLELPDSYEVQHQRAHCERRLGHIFKDSSQLVEANAAYERAASTWNSLLIQKPDNSTVRWSLANTMINAFVVQRDLGQHDAAAWSCYRALELQLAKTDSNSLDIAGDQRPSPEAIRTLLQRASELTSDDLPTPLRLEVALSLEALGEFLAWENDVESAEDAFRLAIKIRTNASDLDSPDDKHYLARSYRELAQMLRDGGHHEHVEPAFRESISIRKTFVDDHPHTPHYREELAHTLRELAQWLQSQGQTNDAQNAYQDSIRSYEALVSSFPNELRHQSDLATTLTQLARLFRDSGQHASRIESLERAWPVFRDLADADPENWRHRLMLGLCFRDIGDVKRQQDQLDEAEHWLLRGAAVLESLIADAPDIEFQRNLRSTRNLLHLVFMTTNRFGDARDNLYELLTHFPASATTLNRLAWLLATCEDTDVRDASAAVELSRKALEFEPRSANYLKTLGVALYQDDKWQQARIALERSVSLSVGGSGWDYFYLVLACHQLGDSEAASHWYALGERWIASTSRSDPELERVWDQASSMLHGVPVAEASDQWRSQQVVNALTDLIDEDPSDWLLFDRRAYAHAALEQWDECAADFAEAHKLNPDFADLFMVRAGALLMADNLEAYQSLSDKVITSLADSPESNHRYLAARIQSIALRPSIDLERLVSLAEESVNQQPTWFRLHTLGLAHHRAGNFREAAEQLTESLAHAPKDDAHVINWLALGLVHHTVHEYDESKAWIERANHWIQTKTNGRQLADISSCNLHPHDWLECLLLQREVATLASRPAVSHSAPETSDDTTPLDIAASADQAD